MEEVRRLDSTNDRHNYELVSESVVEQIFFSRISDCTQQNGVFVYGKLLLTWQVQGSGTVKLEGRIIAGCRVPPIWSCQRSSHHESGLSLDIVDIVDKHATKRVTVTFLTEGDGRLCIHVECHEIMTATVTMSTPTSPSTPSRKRRSIRLPSIQSDSESFSPISYTYGSANANKSHSRKSSQSSFLQFSPITPRPTSSRSKRPSSSRLSIGSNISAGLTSNPGLGNLADELEEAWDSDNETDIVSLEGLQEAPNGLHSPVSIHSNGMAPRSPTRGLLEPPEKPPSPSKQWASMGTHFKTESLYDGSDYGPSSDDEAFDKIAPSLQRKMHDLEEISRISSNTDALSESGGVIPRTAEALRDSLNTQNAIENIVSRLVTAYTSLSTHRSHQGRDVATALHSVLNPLNPSTAPVLDLPVDMIDVIIAEIEQLVTTLPFLPTTDSSHPLIALQGFVYTTCDFLKILHALTDTLIEHRQHLLTATRRLKTVRELVEDLQVEEELMETSIMLIQAGDWDRRCRERHAAKAVGELLEGFKNTWDIDYVDGVWHPEKLAGHKIPVR